MDDVYNNEGHDQNGTFCVMGKFDQYTAYGYYSSVLDVTNEAMGFCTSCEEYMEGLTSNIVIQGNIANNNEE